jgi:hypothetical protein
MTRFVATILALGLVAIGLTGCGSAAGSDTSTPSSGAPSTQMPAPPAHPAALVKAILPTAISGTRYLKTDMETLKDQLAPLWATAKYSKPMNAETRRSWLASGHSVFQLTTTKVALEVDVNLFKTTDAATTMWSLETSLPKGPAERRVIEPTPDGAELGSSYVCAVSNGYSGCTLAWRQGAVIAYTYIVGKGPSALNPGVAANLAPALVRVQHTVETSVRATCDMSDGVLKKAA